MFNVYMQQSCMEAYIDHYRSEIFQRVTIVYAIKNSSIETKKLPGSRPNWKDNSIQDRRHESLIIIMKFISLKLNCISFQMIQLYAKE